MSVMKHALVFDPAGYTELTTTITDTDGVAHEVVYHFYKAITYVAKPVDATYQSLKPRPPPSWTSRPPCGT